MFIPASVTTRRRILLRQSGFACASLGSWFLAHCAARKPRRIGEKYRSVTGAGQALERLLDSISAPTWMPRCNLSRSNGWYEAALFGPIKRNLKRPLCVFFPVGTHNHSDDVAASEAGRSMSRSKRARHANDDAIRNLQAWQDHQYDPGYRANLGR